MNNQIKSQNKTLENSLDLQKIGVEKKSWTEPQIENLDINSGVNPDFIEVAVYRVIGSSPT